MQHFLSKERTCAKKVDVEKLMFAVHTYYTLMVKFVQEVVSESGAEKSEARPW